MLRLGSAACCFVAAMSVACNSSTPRFLGQELRGRCGQIACRHLPVGVSRSLPNRGLFRHPGLASRPDVGQLIESLKAGSARNAWLTARDRPRDRGSCARRTPSCVGARAPSRHASAGRTLDRKSDDRMHISDAPGDHSAGGHGGGETRRGRAVGRPSKYRHRIANLREGGRSHCAPQRVRIVICRWTLIDGAASVRPSVAAHDRTRRSDPRRRHTLRISSCSLQALSRLPGRIPAGGRENVRSRRSDGSRAMPRRCVPSAPWWRPGRCTDRVATIDMLMSEMSAIGERTFHTKNIPALMQALRADKQYLFKNRADLIAYSEAALARAKAAVPNWFGLLPKADVVVQPYPRYREKNASNEYNAPAEDGSRPGLFYINAYQAETKPRSPAESTAFHETIPGHHLQIAIAGTQGHPSDRPLPRQQRLHWKAGAFTLNGSPTMGLYSSDLDRLGMLSSQAFRAQRAAGRGLGIHTMGDAAAVDYMLAHTAEASEDIAAEVVATSSGRDRRPPTCWECSRSGVLEKARSSQWGSSST